MQKNLKKPCLVARWTCCAEVLLWRQAVLVVVYGRHLQQQGLARVRARCGHGQWVNACSGWVGKRAGGGHGQWAKTSSGWAQTGRAGAGGGHREEESMSSGWIWTGGGHGLGVSTSSGGHG